MNPNRRPSIFHPALLGGGFMLAVLAWLTAQPATAQQPQLTIEVPVKLKNLLPGATEGRVVCRASDKNNRVIGGASPRDTRAPRLRSTNGTATFKIGRNGNFDSIVIVKLVARRGKSLNDAVRFVCDLLLRNGRSGFQTPNKSAANSLRPRDKTKLRTKVTGQLPK